MTRDLSKQDFQSYRLSPMQTTLGFFTYFQSSTEVMTLQVFFWQTAHLIPTTICEFKSAIRKDATIYDAWEQIFFSYSRYIPKLLLYTFLAVISNGIRSMFTMIKGAFAKERLLQIIRDFIFYPDDAKAMAIVCRYPQFFAATKMFANIKIHLRPIGDGRGGTYFGATNCGKTYTMLFFSERDLLRLHKHAD